MGRCKRCGVKTLSEFCTKHDSSQKKLDQELITKEKKRDNIAVTSVVILLVISLSLFYVGFHNVDLSYNFYGGIDCNEYGCKPMSEIYINGMAQMQWGFYSSIFNVVLLFVFWRNSK